MTRRAKRRAPYVVRSLAVLFGATMMVAVGCSEGSLLPPPPQCTGTQCSCEEDPLQPLCKGFNTRPDGGMLDTSDAMKVDANDGSLTSDTSTPPDAASDASADASDDGG